MTAGRTDGPPTALARRIDGKATAADLRARVGRLTAFFRAATGRSPGLATVLVGEDPASEVYIRSKRAACAEAGMESVHHALSADTSEADLLALVAALNADPAVDGILVQLPLPAQMDAARVIAAIDPDKDVDGFHVVNAGRLAVGDPAALVPCTPLGCLHLLKSEVGDLSGKHAVVIGRSNIVGKPMAMLLLGESCTVTIAHSRTRDLAALCREAEILVAAVGRPEMVRGDWVKPGATVIDVGINRVPGSEPGKTRLVGDVAFAEAEGQAGAITPVPGGVGPMTIAMLLRNTLVAAHHRAGLPPSEGL
jgi:methylenetetrahydrofolate dehydrogenase (NADP+)/methenyltetrahydrofolate cyclohydrolase